MRDGKRTLCSLARRNRCTSKKRSDNQPQGKQAIEACNDGCSDRKSRRSDRKFCQPNRIYCQPTHFRDLCSQTGQLNSDTGSSLEQKRGGILTRMPPLNEKGI